MTARSRPAGAANRDVGLSGVVVSDVTGPLQVSRNCRNRVFILSDERSIIRVFVTAPMPDITNPIPTNPSSNHLGRINDFVKLFLVQKAQSQRGFFEGGASSWAFLTILAAWSGMKWQPVPIHVETPVRVSGRRRG